MSGDEEFTPRLGRIGDAGRGASRRLGARLAKAKAKLGRGARNPAFTGARIGRAAGAGPLAARGVRGLPARRMRRVVVKVHIARARGGGGRAFRQHLGYIQRDGVDREGLGGELYSRDGETPEASAFAARSDGDRHQFRFIVSAEDAGELGDLKLFTRALVAEMERDLGTRLDWVAVDHHNTGHPHTHIVVRGKDARGADLVIARSYLTEGLRGRARQIITERLGPRRDLEIARSQQRETSEDRWTPLDREIARRMRGEAVEIGAARGSGARFNRTLLLQRLQHLEGVGLAARERAGAWRLVGRWQETLKAMGRQGDIIRSLAAEHGGRHPMGEVSFFETRAAEAAPLTAIVRSHGPEDELRDRRFLLVEDLGGRLWHVPLPGARAAPLPAAGAIVEVSRADARPRAADRVIAAIAAAHGGVWSDALHAADDPASTPAYRDAHARRLEALRQAGLVTRDNGGVWKVPENFLDKARDYETRQGLTRLNVRSWMALERQIRAHAATWLDEVEPIVWEGAYSERIETARRARLAYLREEGLLGASDERLSDPAKAALRKAELDAALSGEAQRSGRTGGALGAGARFDGVFERTINLAQGRVAVFGNAQEFVMAPWREALEPHRGRALVVEARGAGLSWTFAERTRGLSR